MCNYKRFIEKCYLLILFIVALAGCKKDINAGPLENNENPKIELKAFSIKVVDTTLTTASISWTAATDSSFIDSVHYSVYLDSSLKATMVKIRTYKFTNLISNKKYTITIKAYNNRNDSIQSVSTFTTKDNYLKFATKILPANSVVYGAAISPDKGYVFTYQGIRDTTFLGDGTISTRAFHVLKTDSLGNAIWSKRFGFPFTDVAALIKVTSDGYLLLGANFMIKIDFNGNLIWNNIFETTGYTHLSSFVETEDKNIFITGVQDSSPPSLVMINLTPDGNIKWQKTYDVNKQYLTIADLTEIPDDNSVIILGTNDNKFGLWKFDMSGNLIWQNSFGDTLTNAHPTRIQYTGQQLLVSGSSVGDYYLYQMKIYRLDLNGNVVNKTLISDAHFFATIPWFELTADGGFIVLAQIVETLGAEYSAAYKYDSNDNKQWENLYGEFKDGKVILQTEDGGYVIPAMTSYTDGFYLFKTNQLGQY